MAVRMFAPTPAALVARRPPSCHPGRHAHRTPLERRDKASTLADLPPTTPSVQAPIDLAGIRSTGPRGRLPAGWRPTASPCSSPRSAPVPGSGSARSRRSGAIPTSSPRLSGSVRREPPPFIVRHEDLKSGPRCRAMFGALVTGLDPGREPGAPARPSGTDSGMPAASGAAPAELAAMATPRRGALRPAPATRSKRAGRLRRGLADDCLGTGADCTLDRGAGVPREGDPGSSLGHGRRRVSTPGAVAIRQRRRRGGSSNRRCARLAPGWPPAGGLGRAATSGGRPAGPRNLLPAAFRPAAPAGGPAAPRGFPPAAPPPAGGSRLRSLALGRRGRAVAARRAGCPLPPIPPPPASASPDPAARPARLPPPS